MILEALISTTYKRHASALLLAENIFKCSSVRSVIICQLFDCDSPFLVPGNLDYDFGTIYFVNTKGLSISRNEAIRKSKANFGWLVDDDVQICENGIKSLINELFLSDVAALTCRFTDENGKTRKAYKEGVFTHNRFSIMKVSSIEIILNLKYLKENDLLFDTRFGLGAFYPSGEENILLADIIRAGGFVRYYPITLCFHPLETSSTVSYNNFQWQAKGALIKRIFGNIGSLVLIPFFLKRVITKQSRILHFATSLRYMLKGFFNVKS